MQVVVDQAVVVVVVVDQQLQVAFAVEAAVAQVGYHFGLGPVAALGI